MFKQGQITCCPICKNEDKSLEAAIGLSKEFGVPFYECKVCKHSSVRDLRHGVENDSIPSNRRRGQQYSKLIAANDESIQAWAPYKTDPKILEIGPGDYNLCDYLVGKGIRNISSIDVGINFKKRGDPIIKKWYVEIPKTPEEIFNISKEMEKIISAKPNYDLIVSIHSLEHSPDPITMIKLIDENSHNFVIEVPNGNANCKTDKNGNPLTVAEDTICKLNTPGPFPKFPGDAKKRGSGKGFLVGGHYQVFNIDSLEYIAKNILPKGRTYYIGKAWTGHLGLCITTLSGFVSRPKNFKQLLSSNDKGLHNIYREVKV